MKKYKVQFTQTETFTIDVLAENITEAEIKAEADFEKLEEQGTLHHHESGEGGRELGTIYNVTDTDDPFSPITDECQNKDTNGNACIDCENNSPNPCGDTADE